LWTRKIMNFFKNLQVNIAKFLVQDLAKSKSYGLVWKTCRQVLEQELVRSESHELVRSSLPYKFLHKNL